jgi:HPt (histidine-containing phosphotransfer) domain-containing protein
MATLVDQDFFARLHALNDKFAAGVPATLGRLRAAQLELRPEAPDADLLRELHQILHTVAGSAATFGFRVLGQEARQLEQRLRVLMVFEVVAARDWSNWIASLDEYLAWAAIDPKAEHYIEAFPQ